MQLVGVLIWSFFRPEQWEMDQEGQIKHSSSGVSYVVAQLDHLCIVDHLSIISI